MRLCGRQLGCWCCCCCGCCCGVRLRGLRLSLSKSLCAARLAAREHLLQAGSLADAVAQVIQLGAPHLGRWEEVGASEAVEKAASDTLTQ